MHEYIGPAMEEFERHAQRALSAMPEQFRAELRTVVLKIEEFASQEQLESVGVSSRWDLTGLYEGRPPTERTIWDTGEMPSVISLFRQPLLAEMRETGVGLAELVHHVVVHEAGHHFGFSDEDMHYLEDGAD